MPFSLAMMEKARESVKDQVFNKRKELGDISATEMETLQRIQENATEEDKKTILKKSNLTRLLKFMAICE